MHPENTIKPFSRHELLEYLGQHGISTTTIDHAPVFTVEESRDVRGKIAGGHTKNLFLKDKKGQIFLVVAQEDTAIDLKNLHKTLRCGRLSFGKPALLAQLLGVNPGSVTAFGVINDREKAVKVIVDARLMGHETINCHPLRNDATTSILRDDLMAFFRLTGHEPAIVTLPGPQSPAQP